MIEGPLLPILRKSTSNHVHDKAAVFATNRLDVAALFMFPMDKLASIGFENDIAYICIWGTKEELKENIAGYVYVLPSESFKQIGKEYEYQSFKPIQPIEVLHFESVISGMIECNVQVYFINDESIMDRIVAEDYRIPILKDLLSENKNMSKNIRNF